MNQVKIKEKEQRRKTLEDLASKKQDLQAVVDLDETSKEKTEKKEKTETWRPTLVQYNELLKKYDAKAAGARYYDRY